MGYKISVSGEILQTGAKLTETKSRFNIFYKSYNSDQLMKMSPVFYTASLFEFSNIS